MHTAQDCRKYADELDRAAAGLHLRSHRERYIAVAAEWRRLADAIDAAATAPVNSHDVETHLAELRAASDTALDSPLRRALQSIAAGWAGVPQRLPPESGEQSQAEKATY
ncbi:MAG: hypothetical protein WCI21_04870 [Alphaproteobacteria bacterium]